MKLSDYIRIGLTAGIAFNVWFEAGKWTALAITLILVGAECNSWMITQCLKHIDSLLDLMHSKNDDSLIDVLLSKDDISCQDLGAPDYESRREYPLSYRSLAIQPRSRQICKRTENVDSRDLSRIFPESRGSSMDCLE